jgi:aspartate aminotransferase
MGAAMKFAQARLSPPTYAQIASEAALDTPHSYFDNVIEEYKERRDILIEELEKIEGVQVATPKGAFYCIAKLPIKDANAFAQWLLETYDYKNETVMVAPAAGFYSSPNVGLNEVRIAYVLKKEELIKSVTVLKHALQEYKD